jgi:hypothetical protein
MTIAEDEFSSASLKCLRRRSGPKILHRDMHRQDTERADAHRQLERTITSKAQLAHDLSLILTPESDEHASCSPATDGWPPTHRPAATARSFAPADPLPQARLRRVHQKPGPGHHP